MDVFVYGTLTEPAQVARVVDSYVFVGPAVLRGLHPVSGRYPTLAPGDDAAGRLLRTDDLVALDAYEGVDSGLYVRVSVPFDGPEADRVAVYIGDPAALDADATWPGDGDFEERVRRYVRDHGVRVHRAD